EGFLLLLAVENLVDLVGLQGLLPEDVPGMMYFLVESTRCVAVKNGTAQSNVAFAVTVGTARQGSAGEDKLEFTGTWLANYYHAQTAAPRLATVIVLELPDDFLVPVRIEDALEHIRDQHLLVLGVEIAGYERLGDRPEIRHVGPKQPAHLVFV